jgi:hypothetical protein
MGGHESLLDEWACVQVVNRYATAVDTVDIELLRSCFFEDVEAVYMGRVIEPGIQSIVDMILRLSRMRFTVHNLGPVHATATGSTARARSGCLVLAVSEGETPRGVIRGVKYEFELARRDDEWRITRLRHDVLWATAAPPSEPTGEPLPS